MLRVFDFALVPGQDPGLTTGATIHTLRGLFMTVRERAGAGAGRGAGAREAAPVAR